MNEAPMLATSYIAGLLLGGLFYGGLWWTVQKAISSSHPAVWFLASLLLRMAATLAGFLVVSAGNWQRLMVCFFGFLTSRLVITWLTRPADAMGDRPVQEIVHAH